MKPSNELLSQLLARMRKGHPTLKEVYGSLGQGAAITMSEAFVIDGATYDALTREDPNSGKIMKPFVNGADLRRWHVEAQQDQWLICTSKGKIDIDDYPAVKKHLLAFKEQLEKRGPGQKWFELDEALSAHAEQMEKPKIGFAGTADRPSFFMDAEGALLDKNGFIAHQADYYLAGLLNSETYWMLLNGIGAESGGNRYEVRAEDVEMLPIPDASGFQRGDIGRFASFCQVAVRDRADFIRHFQGMTAHNLSPLGIDATLSDKLINWFFLDFPAFREEVIATFGRDIPEDDLELWENYFEQEKQKVMKLNIDIAQAERQIEEVVYDIFGLTKEEIRLLERA